MVAVTLPEVAGTERLVVFPETEITVGSLEYVPLLEETLNVDVPALNEACDEPTEVTFTVWDRPWLLCTLAPDELCDVPLPVGTGVSAPPLEVTGTTVVMMIGGSPTGEIVNSTVEDCGAWSVNDIEVLAEKMSEVDGCSVSRLEVPVLAGDEVTSVPLSSADV